MSTSNSAGDVLVPSLQQQERVIVRKLRELPLPGKLAVKPGDQVQADSVIAFSELPGEVHIVRIADSLGLDPVTVSERLDCKVGQAVNRGDVLFEHKAFFGLFKAKLEAPVTGTIDFISETLGHLAIREPAKPLQLKAYISGTVAEIQAKQSATIQAEATVIQGIFGFGGEKLGRIKLLPGDCAGPLAVGRLPLDCKGAVVVGGTLPSLEVLRELERRGAVGLVVGGIDDGAMRAYLGYDLGLALTGDEKVALTVVVTEGFGGLDIAPRIIELLRPHEGRAASINGATQVRAGALRPEVIVVHETSAPARDTQKQQAGLRIGQAVRVVRVPYFGQAGTIEGLPVDMQTLESGAMARVALVKLNDGTIATVPRANLEIVGG